MPLRSSAAGVDGQLKTYWVTKPFSETISKPAVLGNVPSECLLMGKLSLLHPHTRNEELSSVPNPHIISDVSNQVVPSPSRRRSIMQCLLLVLFNIVQAKCNVYTWSHTVRCFHLYIQVKFLRFSFKAQRASPRDVDVGRWVSRLGRRCDSRLGSLGSLGSLGRFWEVQPSSQPLFGMSSQGNWNRKSTNEYK